MIVRSKAFLPILDTFNIASIDYGVIKKIAKSFRLFRLFTLHRNKIPLQSQQFRANRVKLRLMVRQQQAEDSL